MRLCYFRVYRNTLASTYFRRVQKSEQDPDGIPMGEGHETDQEQVQELHLQQRPLQ
jgi:hypothetical protein